MTLDEEDNRAISVTCRPDLPSDARDVTDQLIQYDYVLNVPNGTVLALVLADVEERVSTRLTQTFLDCRFGLIREFYVYALNSAPNDRIASGCLRSEQVEGFTCYSIAGQLVATIFYIDQEEDREGTSTRMRQLVNSNRTDPRRQMQEADEATQIADERVAEAFANALERIFNETTFESVVASSFAGITNEVPPPPPPPPNRTPRIVGGTIGGLVGAVLVGALIVVLLKRRTEEVNNQYYQQAMDAVDMEFDEMQTEPPGVRGATANVVNYDDDDDDDEEEHRGEADMPVYTATKAESKSRAVEFIGTAAGDQEVRAATSPTTAPPTDGQRERMLEETKRELGPATYDPHISRGYGVSDTVDL